MSLACLFSDWTRFVRKNSCLFWVDRSPILASTSYLATLLWRKGDEDYFSPKLRVRIKDNNNSPHGKFHRFLFPFSSKFSDLNFASYVLYIYPCYVTWHTQWAWVTHGSKAAHSTSTFSVLISPRSQGWMKTDRSAIEAQIGLTCIAVAFINWCFNHKLAYWACMKHFAFIHGRSLYKAGL